MYLDTNYDKEERHKIMQDQVRQTGEKQNFKKSRATYKSEQVTILKVV